MSLLLSVLVGANVEASGVSTHVSRFASLRTFNRDRKLILVSGQDAENSRKLRLGRCSVVV